MTETGLLASWVTWTPLERAAVRSVYFHQRGLADTAHRNVVRVQDVSRALQAVYHRVAALILESEPDGGTAGSVRVTAAVRGLAELRTASWSWDTASERMTWSDGIYDLYGYPAGAVPATIGLHQAHKHPEDRVAVERLTLTGATERGPVVFPQRIVRTDGTLCRVVMRVTRQPGPHEVLTGLVAADVRDH